MKRGAIEARLENPETMFHESEDVARQAQLEGIREGLELLQRIRKAGNDPLALERIRDGFELE